jgi:hypothetical protein
MSDGEVDDVYADMRKNGADIPEWWGKPAPDSEIQYAVSFAIPYETPHQQNYPYAYQLGTYSSRQAAEQALNDYKTGKVPYTLTGRDGTEKEITTLGGLFQVSKQHSCVYK